MNKHGALEDFVDCDSVLTKDLVILKESSDVRLSWLKSVTEANYEQSKAKADLTYVGTGLFEGDYASFNERRRQYLEQEKFDYSNYESRQMLIQKVSPDAVHDWRDCVLAKLSEGSLACWFENANTVGGQLFIQWKGSALAPILHDITIRLSDGATIDGGSNVKHLQKLSGQHVFNVLRSGSNARVTGSVNGSAGEGNVAASVALPSIVPPAQIFRGSVDVGSLGHAELDVGPFKKDALVKVTVYAEAIGTITDNAHFRWGAQVPDNPPYMTGDLSLPNNSQRSDSKTFSFALRAGAKQTVKADNGTHNADNLHLSIQFEAVVG